MRMQVGPYCTVAMHAGARAGADVVRVSGELDAGAADELWPLLQSQIEQAQLAVVVDLTELKFFGSVGLKLLVDGRTAAQARQIGFAVAATHQRVLKPLRLTEVDKVVLVRSDVDQAIDAALLDRIAPAPPAF